MKFSKRGLIWLGTAFSIILFVIVLARLNWHTFFSTLRVLSLPTLFFTGLILSFNIALRAVRWNLIANKSLTHFNSFWQATNIGYLGNMIYPARAGEILRMIAIHRFISLVLGRAVSSVVIDRMLDLIMAGLFMLVVLWIHGNQINPTLGRSVLGVFLITTLILVFVIGFAHSLHLRLKAWTVQGRWQHLKEGGLQALEGVQGLRKAHHLLTIILLTLFIFGLDYYAIWQVMFAFGWQLPYEAALTVGVFIVLGISLPSSPGYIGVYQIACVFSLALYHIEESSAVAYSIILQLTVFLVIGVQGILVTTYCGFDLSQERQVKLKY